MPKVTISQDDIFQFHLRDEAETTEMFGPDYLEDYGVKVSNRLLDNYKKAKAEMEKVQKELANISYKKAKE